MAKDQVILTIDPVVLADTDADAAAAGLNRCEYVEMLLRHEHYRRLIARATPKALPADAQTHEAFDWQGGQTA